MVQHFVFIFIIVFESQVHPVREGNRLGASREADRFAHGRTTVPRWKLALRPWLSIPSFFLPQASSQRSQILSSCGCLDTGALSRSPPTPRSWNSALRTWPGRARIGGGRYRSWKARKDWRRPARDGPRSVWGGLQSRQAFDWRGWHAGAGSFGAELGRSGSGSEMKS